MEKELKEAHEFLDAIENALTGILQKNSIV
jgi:hypothetical protein